MKIGKLGMLVVGLIGLNFALALWFGYWWSWAGAGAGVYGLLYGAYLDWRWRKWERRLADEERLSAAKTPPAITGVTIELRSYLLSYLDDGEEPPLPAGVRSR